MEEEIEIVLLIRVKDTHEAIEYWIFEDQLPQGIHEEIEEALMDFEERLARGADE